MWVIFDGNVENIWNRIETGEHIESIDPKTKLSVDCAKLTKKIFDGWSDDIPARYLKATPPSPVYSEDGKEIYLIHDNDDEYGYKYKFLVKEDGKEQESSSFSIARYSCFWYGKYN